MPISTVFSFIRRTASQTRSAVSGGNCVSRKSSAARTAWAASMNRPPSAGMPLSIASSTSRVRSGLYTASITACTFGKASSSSGFPPLSGNMPQGVVLMMISASPCSRAASSYRTAPSFPLRLMRITCAAPSCPAAYAAVRLVPPVPAISTFFPRISGHTRRISRVSPSQSVLYPFSRPPRFTTVFTAPMARAVSLISSRYGITACL